VKSIDLDDTGAYVVPCPVCRAKARMWGTNRDSNQYECHRCGRFELTRSALAVVERQAFLASAETQAAVSHEIRKLSATALSEQIRLRETG
jgi:hypothetical protein